MIMKKIREFNAKKKEAGHELGRYFLEEKFWGYILSEQDNIVV